jgi:hypothetical protein
MTVKEMGPVTVHAHRPYFHRDFCELWQPMMHRLKLVDPGNIATFWQRSKIEGDKAPEGGFWARHSRTPWCLSLLGEEIYEQARDAFRGRAAPLPQILFRRHLPLRS